MWLTRVLCLRSQNTAIKMLAGTVVLCGVTDEGSALLAEFNSCGCGMEDFSVLPTIG